MSVDYSIPRSKRITVKTFDVKSIDAAIAEVKGRKQYTERRIRMIADVLAARGEEIAKQKCREYTNGDGDLEKSIWCEVKVSGGKFKTIIHMDAPYAAYVEFGTGIVGKAFKHPNFERRGWDYDVNKRGTAGWVYEDDAGDHYWTMGQPAKPIMWETAQQLKQEFPIIVREVFKY